MCSGLLGSGLSLSLLFSTVLSSLSGLGWSSEGHLSEGRIGGDSLNVSEDGSVSGKEFLEGLDGPVDALTDLGSLDSYDSLPEGLHLLDELLRDLLGEIRLPQKGNIAL